MRDGASVGGQILGWWTNFLAGGRIFMAGGRYFWLADDILVGGRYFLAGRRKILTGGRIFWLADENF